MKYIISFLLTIASATTFSSELFSVKDKTFQGKDYDFSLNKGRVTLIVNIASRCGYTPQLDGLQKLYEKYKSKNLTIIGVPSNDFGGQSPEGNVEFKKFCELNYGVKFPILRKSIIKGAQKSDLYKYLTTNSPRKGEVKWNFEKFLIDKEGNIAHRFKSSVTPDSNILIKSIENLL
jgi:glutathione peroxidase